MINSVDSLEFNHRFVYIDEIDNDWWFRWWHVRSFVSGLGLGEDEIVMVINGKINSAGKSEKVCGVNPGTPRILTVRNNCGINK